MSKVTTRELGGERCDDYLVTWWKVEGSKTERSKERAEIRRGFGSERSIERDQEKKKKATETTQIETTRIDLHSAAEMIQREGEGNRSCDEEDRKRDL
ncbi:hypothetical protein ACLOJK_020119 [Asimina triloba]